MSQAQRQSELFAGNDWTAIYRAFTQVNLASYDFQTIRSAMITYINMNYPEQYNDWVNSSEFVAILDLVAYMGQSLAFRIDLNARENFMDIARRRESVLRLSRFLSYNARRNVAASGMLKLASVRTTESITDANGASLNNKKINWNDPSNSDWFDQMVTVLNSAFVDTNPFGTYLAQDTINSIPTQLYRFNTSGNNSGQYSFTSMVDNSTMNFEITNMTIDSSSSIVENYPNPQGKFQICYRNDGNGYSSSNCGFFALFKQGTMNHVDYNIPNPIANNTITIATNDINDSDVWVQTVNDNGYISTNGIWTQVGYVPTDDITKIIVSSDNITYNSISSTVKNIYQVVTLANDQIMIRFGDGNFGSIPTGNIRIWYRVSANESYYIRPDEIQNISVDISYLDSSGKTQTLTTTWSLEDTITNASPTQTDDEIRRISGQIYSTQGRMVSGSDYNSLPMTIGSALKIKATNRIYSGQSRYLDLNDPSGQYQNTKTFSDDGALYVDTSLNYTELSLSNNMTPSQITSSYMTDIISNKSLYYFMLNEYITNASEYKFSNISNIFWKQSTSSNYLSTGLFVDQNGNSVVVGSNSTTAPLNSIGIGCLLQMKTSTGYVWASVDSINSDGTTEYVNSEEGPIELNTDISSGASLEMVIPYFSTSFSIGDQQNLVDQFTSNQTFGIGFDYSTQEFYYISSTNISEEDYNFSTKGSNADSSWIILCEYSPSNWRIYSRKYEYVFESRYSNKFFFIDNTTVTNTITGKTNVDQIDILKYNLPKTFNNFSTSDISFNIVGNYIYSDGYMEPRRVQVGFDTSSTDGYPTNPDAFILINEMLSNGTTPNLVFHKYTTDQNGYQVLEITDDVVISPNTGNVVYTPGPNITDGEFVASNTSYDSSNYVVNYGIRDLDFKWTHLATTDDRIDPSITNIIDILILTSGYYDEMNTWRENGYDVNSIPVYPSEVELESSFSNIEEYKMFSDEIIWKPVKFKLIGGATADPTLQFTIKAITLPGTPYSNGEIQANILSTINTYFDINSWDFGETFYASELIGYLHQQLLNSISSIVLVPSGSNQSFGNLFQITCNSDELFFPTLTISDVEIITAITNSNLRIS